jgi:SAM-dependent methyltransferase
MSDARLFAPTAARNRAPILDALRPHLPTSGTVLEIASGTGEHVAHFAAALPTLTWQPTDPAADRRASIDAWTAGLPNVRPARALDAASSDWQIERADAVLCINLIHIAPWAAAEGLVAGAARILPPGGLLELYGPYRRRGKRVEPGNEAFDSDLRRRDPSWGVREVEDLAALASRAGFGQPTIVAMPANNLTLLFRRVPQEQALILERASRVPR